MRTQVFALLAAAAFAFPAMAQEGTEAPVAKSNTEKLWMIQTSGIGG